MQSWMLFSKILGKILKRNNDLDVTDLTDDISKLSLDNQITHEKLDDVQNTLDIVVEDRVVKPEDKDTMNTNVIYESIDQGPNIFYIVPCTESWT